MKFILSWFLLVYSSHVFANAVDGSQFDVYLNNMKSVAIDFVQIDANGKKATGTLLISKPYKFRCNYYPPFPLLILGNKNYLSVYDYDMDTTTRIKASENMFNFLLLNGQDLSKYFNIKSIEDVAGTINLTLDHIESGKRSIIAFDKLNKQIKSITIFETDNTISILFNKVRQIEKFDDDLFILKNTDIFGPPKRLSKEDLEKKLQRSRVQ
jgi:outer membrane lipoprotein-sorting protein